ncbi:hypothetical protein DMC30DRAFT_405647 [Rhodotorula diobovata]|uniref:Uncharacterized protein n=1 Tax=Rhodotorula diobovata TaxID=5288 RepID=A0A5C5FNV9_9BASI|nr:hypothetical protein DMC30DRAFT_405647 [Rhodotorula diobovata]
MPARIQAFQTRPRQPASAESRPTPRRPPQSCPPLLCPSPPSSPPQVSPAAPPARPPLDSVVEVLSPSPVFNTTWGPRSAPPHSSLMPRDALSSRRDVFDGSPSTLTHVSTVRLLGQSAGRPLTSDDSSGTFLVASASRPSRTLTSYPTPTVCVPLVPVVTEELHEHASIAYARRCVRPGPSARLGKAARSEDPTRLCAAQGRVSPLSQSCLGPTYSC